MSYTIKAAAAAAKQPLKKFAREQVATAGPLAKAAERWLSAKKSHPISQARAHRKAMKERRAFTRKSSKARRAAKAKAAK